MSITKYTDKERVPQRDSVPQLLLQLSVLENVSVVNILIISSSFCNTLRMFLDVCICLFII